MARAKVNKHGKYCFGYKTDLEESFHRVTLKYWKKGTSYQFEEYCTRRALAALNWNENRDNNSENTYYFRKTIADQFHQLLLSRTKGRKTNKMSIDFVQIFKLKLPFLKYIITS